MNEDKLKQVIQEANREKWFTEQKHIGKIYVEQEPIRLADVLMAMPEKLYVNSKTGRFGHFHKHDHFNPPFIWNLADNNLDNQSDETKRFLLELLTP